MSSPVVGGQAVIEGVMMRHNNQLAIAVRKPDQEISLHKELLNPLNKKYKILGIPIVRGFVAFLEMMVVGMRALTYSANQALEEEEEELGGWQLALTMIISLGVGVGLFFLLPTFLMRFFQSSLSVHPFFLNLGEGVIRLTILIVYIASISRMEDIKRVYQYHGAEHKAVHCHEAGKELTVANAKEYSALHPRCGTAFLFVVVLTSIVLFSFFGWPGIWQRIALRLVLIPVVAGLGYEIIKLAAKKKNSPLRLLVVPGLWMQKLTTREPDDSQLEVAIKALEAAMAENDGQLESA